MFLFHLDMKNNDIISFYSFFYTVLVDMVVPKLVINGREVEAMVKVGIDLGVITNESKKYKLKPGSLINVK